MIDKLKELAEAYSRTAEGDWLNEFDWRAVPVKFRPLGYDIVGFHAFGKITLAEVVDASFIFDIYIHELRHVWQWKKHPLRYIAGKLYRPLIEDDADREESRALKWYENRRNNTNG